MLSNANKAQQTSMFVIECSRWHIARIVEQFNARGIYPTIAEIDAEIQKIEAEGKLNFFIGFDQGAASVITSAMPGLYYDFRRSVESLRFKVLPRALQKASECEQDPRYDAEFVIHEE